MRVPMIVVSPWSVGGYVCSETFDHSSTVRFLETWLGIKAPDLGEWRRTVAGDLTSAFDFATPVPPPERVVSESLVPAPVTVSGRWYPQVPSEQRMPVQEPGVRPARPLPYQPDGSARRRARSVEITMSNTGTASAHFALYGYLGEVAKPLHFDVLGMAREVLYFPGPVYDLTLIGPNGFRREFHGGPGDRVEVTSLIDPETGVIEIAVQNTADTAAEVMIVPLAYGGSPRNLSLDARGAGRIPWQTSTGWYDLLLTVAGDSNYARRLMGRIEDGRPGITG
jgi:phospholipase C